jgi:hypothetical protein
MKNDSVLLIIDGSQVFGFNPYETTIGVDAKEISREFLGLPEDFHSNISVAYHSYDIANVLILLKKNMVISYNMYDHRVTSSVV